LGKGQNFERIDEEEDKHDHAGGRDATYDDMGSAGEEDAAKGGKNGAKGD
jgi:hypothetical protein